MYAYFYLAHFFVDTAGGHMGARGIHIYIYIYIYVYTYVIYMSIYICVCAYAYLTHLFSPSSHMGDEGVPCHPTVITLLYSMRVSFYFDVSFDIHVRCDIPGGPIGARGIHI